ncbi:hypothetical protein H2198_007338 [Neophaeococcomyces mojaviensis]|uniref:Uncharacterized protein n=1 Tax=Neophaeococcomyces mojaviensis TaxID=3383035 RepID=A0ACC3A0H3_9EURO|nr:hypothetical protein H2198_007338 [Knufia sp. JES_112]
MSAEKYDEDAQMLESLSDVETDTDSIEETLGRSTKPKDKEVLRDYDEAQRLLTERKPESGLMQKFNAWPHHEGKQKHNARKGKSRRRSRTNEGTSNLVYEMEEGFKDTSSNNSTDSLVLTGTQWQKVSANHGLYLRFILMSLAIAILFVLLAYGAYKASHPSQLKPVRQFSNGTHVFEATTILISLDGFRADFLQRGLTPSLNAFIESGVSPKYMLPSFPSVTFPNHYTLVTGLYPESHGIVGNQFWDPEFEEEFYYTNTSNSMQPKWWSKAEPLWVTAEKHGIKTAVHMWPGSEAHILGVEPTYLDEFNAQEKLPKKVDRILQLLDMEREHRPQLIAAYVPDVDRDGHAFGPNSTEIRATIAEADNMLTLLIEGLYTRNLTEIVNVIVVSDHGMATMSVNRMLQLDDIVDMSLIDHIDGWPLRGLRLKNPDRDVPVMHKQLLDAAKTAGTFDVYTLETMPERYHFTNNPRIAPLWVVPKTGWLVIEKEEFDIAAALNAGEEFHPRGIHGFDHEHPLMRAIFVARGPAFPHAPNSRVPVFQNIEVYNIVCDSLDIQPYSNNGTVRLPMKTEGLHSDFEESSELLNDDPADIHDEPAVAENPSFQSGQEFSDKNHTENLNPDKSKDTSKGSWWTYLHDRLQKAKDWAEEFIDSIRNNKEASDQASTS